MAILHVGQYCHAGRAQSTEGGRSVWLQAFLWASEPKSDISADPQSGKRVAFLRMAMSNLQARFPRNPVYGMAGLELVLNYGKQRVGALWVGSYCASSQPKLRASMFPIRQPCCRPLALSVYRLALAVVV